MLLFPNPIALAKAKIVCNFGLSQCNRVKVYKQQNIFKIFKMMKFSDMQSECEKCVIF